MSTNFPGSLDTTTQLPNSRVTGDVIPASDANNKSDAIIAVETKVGTGASTPSAGKVLRSGGTGASAWGQVVLTTDVTGVLPIGNMATGTPTGSKFVRDDGVLAVPSGGSAVTTKDEGSTLTAATSSIDFVGAGVSATNSGGAVTVTIAGGGGSSAFNPYANRNLNPSLSTDCATATSGTGAVTGGDYRYLTINSGATSHSKAEAYWDLGSTVRNVFDHEAYFAGSILGDYQQPDDFDTWIGLGRCGFNTTAWSSTGWRYIGFRIYQIAAGGFLCKATNGDGTSITETSVTIPNADANRYRGVFSAVFTPATDIKYYIDGTLVATHTTNLPAGSERQFNFATTNLASSVGGNTRLTAYEFGAR